MCSRPKGFGFIEFKDPRDADNALNGLDGTEFMGREIQVRASLMQQHDIRRSAAVVFLQRRGHSQYLIDDPLPVVCGSLCG